MRGGLGWIATNFDYSGTEIFQEKIKEKRNVFQKKLQVAGIKCRNKAENKFSRVKRSLKL